MSSALSNQLLTAAIATKFGGRQLLQEMIAPKVAKLCELEKSTQSMYWAIRQQFAAAQS